MVSLWLFTFKVFGTLLSARCLFFWAVLSDSVKNLTRKIVRFPQN
jgi:hypothetical protein